MIDIARIIVNILFLLWSWHDFSYFITLLDGLLLVAIPGCTVERNIPFRNIIPGSTTMDWYFVKTASKFEVWCQGKMVSAVCSLVMRTFDNKLSMVKIHYHRNYNHNNHDMLDKPWFLITRSFLFFDQPPYYPTLFIFSTTHRCFLTRVKLAARRWAATLLTSSLEDTNLIPPRR